MIATPPLPERITLELTNQCNFNCVMCPGRLDHTTAMGAMKPELFRSLVDQFAEGEPKALVPFFRGESLLHPQIAELLTYAKQKGLGPIQLATNGSLMTNSMATKLLDTGVDFISFSLDTMDADEYLKIRQGISLDQVVQNILGLIQLRDKGSYPTEIQISATRTAINHKSIDKLISHWRNKVDRTRVYYEHSTDGHPGSLECPEVPAEMERRPCHKPFNDMVVYWNGWAALCNHDWQRDDSLGDLTRQSLAEVWRGPAYEEIRRQHRASGELLDDTCLHCDHWKMYYLEKPFIGELYTPEQKTESPAFVETPGQGSGHRRISSPEKAL